MLIHVSHQTRYAYDAPADLGPHTVRKRPRQDGAQRVLKLSLSVSPRPAGQSELLDAEGNLCTRYWFDGAADTLQFELAAEVRTLRANPFDFLLRPEAVRLGFAYSPAEAAGLVAYLGAGREPSECVASFARDAAEAAGGATVDFLVSLAQRVAEEVRLDVREHPGTWQAEQTLTRGHGACRDLAMVFVRACQSQGLAARFVSGYCLHPDEMGVHDLHAWAEVFLPGAGWRGFDPAQGMAVADQHIALAASHDPALTLPITGRYDCPGSATLSHHVSVRAIDE